MTYGVSTSILSRLPLADCLPRLARSGIRQIELSAEAPDFAQACADPAALRGTLSQLELAAPVGHAVYSSVNLSALDENERQASVDDVATCLRRLASVGIRVAVVHPTGFSSAFTAENRATFVAQSLRSMHELAPVAADLGMNLAWENLPHHGNARPFHDMAELLTALSDLPPHMGLCLDTTHARISGHDPLEQFKIAHDRLLCLHLHDTDGTGDRHWVPGRGIIAWEPFVAHLDEVRFAGPRTIEAIAAEGEEDQVVAQVAHIAQADFAAGSLAPANPRGAG